MPLRVPPLTLRLDKGSPLTSEEGDENLKLLRDFANGLAQLFEVVFNPDGTLKNGTIDTDALKDRAVTQRKLDWLANFYCTAGGVDNYTTTITPDDGFDLTSYGDGAATAFVLPVKFTSANTGPVTLDVNAAGAKSVKKNGGTDELIAGDIKAGSVHLLIFDGTYFQIVTPTNPAVGHGIQVIITGAGNFTVPVGVYLLDVELVGGGGGGGGSVTAAGGGGGGYISKQMAVAPAAVIAYSVGAGGTASTGSNAGDGGDTTFGALTAGGGKGGDGNKGAGGTAIGGDINCPGRNGDFAGAILSQTGIANGGDAGHGMGFGAWLNANVSPTTPQPATGYGGGGCGDQAAPYTASSVGGDGVIIIRW
jgi:hypothetical protein